MDTPDDIEGQLEESKSAAASQLSNLSEKEQSKIVQEE